VLKNKSVESLGYERKDYDRSSPSSDMDLDARPR
jgi:hypothetical protein